MYSVGIFRASLASEATLLVKRGLQAPPFDLVVRRTAGPSIRLGPCSCCPCGCPDHAAAIKMLRSADVVKLWENV